MSRAGPEVPFRPNQRPERVSIPPFHLLQERTTSDIRPATLSSWLKQTILLCYKQADQQALDLVQELKRMTLGPSQPIRPFCGGVSVDQISQACHWKTQHTYKFLPKRPYLVGQRQQYVSGTSGGGTTSPRPFPADQSSSERKMGEAHPLQPSLQESKPRI